LEKTSHRNLRITEDQRQRFVELYMTAVDAAGLPTDEEFREAIREHVEFGTQVALREVPRWTWAGDD